MLVIKVEGQEFFDPTQSMFFTPEPIVVRLEHSLISISKWEAIWEKPYLPTPGIEPGMTGYAEQKSYIECMIIGKVPDYISTVLLQKYNKQISDYIEKKHTATKVYRGGPQVPSRKVITSELIYYWMVRFGIPFECQQWHLNRLLTLIDVCSVKEAAATKAGKMSPKEAAAYKHNLNRARRGG